MKNQFCRMMALIFVSALVLSLASSLGARIPQAQAGRYNPRSVPSPRTDMTVFSTMKWMRAYGAFYSGLEGGWEDSGALRAVPTGYGGVVVAGDAYFTTDPPDSVPRCDIVVMEVLPSGGVAWQVLFEADPTIECENSAESLIRTGDGGYLVVGSTAKRTGLAHEALAMKLGHEGGVQWIKAYTQKEWWLYAFDVIAAPDGGFIIAGDTGAGGLLLLKIDAWGNPVWHKNFAISISSIHATQDGGFIAAGGADDLRAHIIKFDGRGEIEWHQSYVNDPGWNCGDYRSGAYSVSPTTDGGYIAAGITWGCNMESSTGWVCKLDPAGGTVWQKGYDLVGSPLIFQTKEGGYFAKDDYNAVKLDASGAIEWQKSYRYFLIYSALQTDDGGYLMSGILASAGTVYSLGVACVDQNGMIGPSCTEVFPGFIQEKASSLKALSGGAITSRLKPLTVRLLKYNPYPRTCEVDTRCVFGQMPRHFPDREGYFRR